MDKFIKHIALMIMILGTGNVAVFSQETVFNGLKSNIKRADKFYQDQSYQNALDLYLEVERQGKGDHETNLKIARTYHSLNKPDRSVMWYEKYMSSGKKLNPEDTNHYAESLISQGKYQKAADWLKKQQRPGKEDQETIAKIWRLQNIEHLYTDSVFYKVHPVEFNTPYTECGPAFVSGGLAFVSNRKEKGGIKRIDPVTNQPFLSVYYLKMTYDSLQGRHLFSKPKVILKEQSKKLHQGTVATSGAQLLFTRSEIIKGNDQSRLQLFWASGSNGRWKGERPFKFNGSDYSVGDPSFSDDGKTLFFVSDMPGGFGGNDLYRSELGKNGWSKPVNLGPEVNTSKNESSPFIYQGRYLYFASNGHGGLGGLDIFRVDLKLGPHGEVRNLGFPVNTPADDFGLIINPAGTHGFFATNRESGGFDDNIYEVQIDLQEYPLVIGGTVRYNNPDWGAPDSTKYLTNAELKLIDNQNGVTVYQTTTDEQGRFSLSVPYSSQYRIKVIDQRVGQPSVSLEIPRNRKLHAAHEIVVVREKFQEIIRSSRTETSSKTDPAGANNKLGTEK